MTRCALEIEAPPRIATVRALDDLARVSSDPSPLVCSKLASFVPPEGQPRVKICTGERDHRRRVGERVSEGDQGAAAAAAVRNGSLATTLAPEMDRWTDGRSRSRSSCLPVGLADRPEKMGAMLCYAMLCYARSLTPSILHISIDRGRRLPSACVRASQSDQFLSKAWSAEGTLAWHCMAEAAAAATAGARKGREREGMGGRKDRRGSARRSGITRTNFERAERASAWSEHWSSDRPPLRPRRRVIVSVAVLFKQTPLMGPTFLPFLDFFHLSMDCGGGDSAPNTVSPSPLITLFPGS